MNNLVNTNNKFNYISSFDALRGIALTAVLFIHGGYGLFKGGWIGVDLFFVLSGYLITSILKAEYQQSNTISLSKFYFRRFMRLFPVLLLGVFLANILFIIRPLSSNSHQLLTTFASIFYFTNLLNRNTTGNMAHIWSLSVEEHFYILWPLLLPLLLRVSKLKCTRILIAIIIALSIFRIVVFNYKDHLMNTLFVIDYYLFTFCRIDSILCGALLALLPAKTHWNNITSFIEKKPTASILMLFSVFLVICLTIDVFNPVWYNGGFILTNILCMLIVYMAIKYQGHFLFSNLFLRWLGKRSYGIYIYHFPIFMFVISFRRLHDPNIFYAIFLNLIRFSLSFLIAELSYRYIEQPVAKYRSRLRTQKNDKQQAASLNKTSLA